MVVERASEAAAKSALEVELAEAWAEGMATANLELEVGAAADLLEFLVVAVAQVAEMAVAAVVAPPAESMAAASEVET